MKFGGRIGEIEGYFIFKSTGYCLIAREDV